MYTKEFRPQLAAKSVHLDVLSHEIDKEKKTCGVLWELTKWAGSTTTLSPVRCCSVFKRFPLGKTFLEFAARLRRCKMYRFKSSLETIHQNQFLLLLL